jgi:hypothetical protein
MAGAKSIGSVFAELSMRDKNFSANLNRAGRNMRNFTKGAGRMRTSTMAIGAAVAAGGAAAIGFSAWLANGAKKAFDLGGRLSDVSEQTGIAVKDVMRLERAFKDGGLSAATMGTSISKMQKNIASASSGGKDPFAKLGLSAKELLKLDPAEQFELIGKALKDIDNVTARNAIAGDIFGTRAGSKLMTVLGKGLKDADASLGKMPELAGRFANAFDRASDIIGGLPQKSEQFFVGFASGIIGTVLPELEKVNKWDFTEFGQKLGATIGAAFQGLTDGTIFEIMLHRFLSGVESIAGRLYHTLAGAFETAIQFFKDKFKEASDFGGTYLARVWVANFGSDAEKDAVNNGALDQKPKDSKDYFAEFEKNLAKRAEEFANREDVFGKSADTLWNTLKLNMETANINAQLQGMEDKNGEDDEVRPTTLAANEKLNLNESDYLKRGLALSGATVQKDDKKVSLMQEIKNILRAIQVADPAVKFA